MPASTALADVISNIVAGPTSAGSRVHTGARLQSGALPAVIVEHLSAERAALSTGATPSLVRHQFRVAGVAGTMIDARNLADLAASFACSGLTAAGSATYKISESVVEEPQSGEGDEEQPAVASLTIESLYRE